MTIKGISNFFKKNKGLDTVSEVPISKFKNKRVIIDGGIMFYSISARVHKELIFGLKNPISNYSKDLYRHKFILGVLKFVFLFINNSIDIAIVYDGEKSNDKKVCHEDRKKEREKNKNKMDINMDAYRQLKENDPLNSRLTNLDKEVRKARSNVTYVDYKLIEFTREIFDSIGIPNFKAKGEAEALCCSLVNEKKAYAVYSTDSDCYAFGIKLMINKINEYKETFEVVSIKKIIKQCRLDLEDKYDDEDEETTITKPVVLKFLKDFCIMCGCDFNKNIPGIGPVNAYKLLLTNLSIGNIDHKKKEILNFKLCRKLLSDYETNITVEMLEMNINYDNYITLLADYEDVEVKYLVKSLKHKKHNLERS